jgi:alanyl-tRNA synthetase
MPHNDPTLAFVNAGMCQFKAAILGSEPPVAARATNAQKCIRMADLKEVGVDGHHQTFFEMLGAWSFGDYFRREAVQMAWQLVTGPLGLPADRLYVTYFGGCQELGLPADEETRNVWLEAGVDPERVLAFSGEHNFWSMGAAGPCGPSTEIHYDHRGGDFRPECVNAGRDDLVEIGNVVLMQYQRPEPNAPLVSLASKVVDVGFGLERLAAISAGSMSNYDSDLFWPLMSTVAASSGAPPYTGAFTSDATGKLDAAYRTLADHSRMVRMQIAKLFWVLNFFLQIILPLTFSP